MHTLDDVLPLARRVRRALIRTLEVRDRPGDLGAILAAHPNLVLAISHATPLSWVPIPFALAIAACAAGQGDRVPFGVVDRFFFKFKPLRPVGRFLTQADGHQSFDGLLARLQGAPGHDLVIFPEGANTFFGGTDGIRPFRSPRFVELAIRAGVPVLLVVHRGTEAWSRGLPMPRALLGRWGAAGARLNLPRVPRKIERLVVAVDCYQPTLSAADLSPDPATRRGQVQAEADAVHARMVALHATL